MKKIIGLIIIVVTFLGLNGCGMYKNNTTTLEYSTMMIDDHVFSTEKVYIEIFRKGDIYIFYFFYRGTLGKKVKAIKTSNSYIMDGDIHSIYISVDDNECKIDLSLNEAQLRVKDSPTLIYTNYRR